MTDATAPNHNGGAFADTPEHRQRLLGGPQRLSALIGIGGLIAFLILAAIYYGAAPPDDPTGWTATGARQPFLSFLTGYMFWTLIGLGSVFFLCLQYVTGGRWGILLRRPLESAAKALFVVGVPGFVVVAITMCLGEHSIYWWARHPHLGHDKTEHKEPGEPAQKEGTPPSAGVRADVV
ncbi:MAG TPA: hypothetical protein VKD90_06675, partial [Gemmataceae bacterium]|nr:hypothetical protein [Gemmataceae bacterium]